MSSASSGPKHPPCSPPLYGDDSRQRDIVTPMTSCPRDLRSAAVVEESTPPLMPTMIFIEFQEWFLYRKEYDL